MRKTQVLLDGFDLRLEVACMYRVAADLKSENSLRGLPQLATVELSVQYTLKIISVTYLLSRTLITHA